MRTVLRKNFFTIFRRLNPRPSYLRDVFVRLILFSNVTPYSGNKTKDIVSKEIEYFSELLFQWFDFNYMKKKVVKKVIYYSQEM